MNTSQAISTPIGSSAKILLCTAADPLSDPRGGGAAFAKHLLTAFPGVFSVASTTAEQSHTGRWQSRLFRGGPLDHFSLGHMSRANSRPLVPERLRVYALARRHMGHLHACNFRGILLDGPELLMAASNYRWKAACYSFAGVENPVRNSRYPFARVLGSWMEKRMASALRSLSPEVLVAAADCVAIERMQRRVGAGLDRFPIYSLPTRFDDQVFKMEDQTAARDSLGLDRNASILVATGRVSWVKGWPLLLEAVRLLRSSIPTLRLIFVGDGEDRADLERLAGTLGVKDLIHVTGFVSPATVCAYLNAADVYVVASHYEGWSVAMVEALACGKRIVSTHVSGAATMVQEGVNGTVVADRSAYSYAEGIRRTLALPRAASSASIELAQQYSIDNLRSQMSAIWPVLCR